jgi:hypothetical protein
MGITEAFECLKSWYTIKGWDGESNYLEEVIGVEIARAVESHVEVALVDETAVETAVYILIVQSSVV